MANMANMAASSNSTINVRLVSAQELMYKGTATFVIAEADGGEIGIKPNHAPFLSILKPGQAIIQNGAEEEVFYVSGGVIEVQPNMVTILADDVERAKDIDEAKAEQARKNAEKLLQSKTADIEYAKLQVQLAQSLAQLRALKRFRKQLQKTRT